MSSGTTRRGFLQASAAAAAGTALGDLSALAQSPNGPNLILIIVDSLRADAVYERAIATPNIDALMAQGMRFTSAYPEAMPTVPARNSILGGRRTFPFRHWHDYPGLLASPGWAPLREVDQALPAVLRSAGYWTAYVTDNPFIGFSRPYKPLRKSVNSLVRTGGQIGGAHPVSSVPDKVLRHWLHPAISPDKRRRVGLYLANSRYWNDERALVRREGDDGRRAHAGRGRQARPLRDHRRRLRAARALDAAAHRTPTCTASGAAASPPCRATAA